MVLDQLAEERVVMVGHHVVIAQARAHEYLFYALELAQLAQQVQVIRVIGLEIFACGREQAAFVFAQPVFLLLLAGREAEVCGRAADVVDIALETRHLYDLLGFGDHAFVAARLDIAPLMEGERAEVARAEAAAVVDDRELHFLNGGHAAQRFIGRVIGAHIGQSIDVVHLRGGQGPRGRVLDEHALAMALQERLAAHRVLLVILQLDRAGVVRFAHAHILIGGAFDRLKRKPVRIMRQIGGAAHTFARIRALFAVL